MDLFKFLKNLILIICKKNYIFALLFGKMSKMQINVKLRIQITHSTLIQLIIYSFFAIISICNFKKIITKTIKYTFQCYTQKNIIMYIYVRYLYFDLILTNFFASNNSSEVIDRPIQ